MSYRYGRAVACCALSMCLWLLTGLSTAATINVDPGVTHQTIDGFGAFGAMPSLKRAAGDFWEPRPDAYELDRFITDLGASVVRFALPPQVYPVQGEDYDWEGVFTGSGGMTGTFRLMRELKKRGTDRFIFSIWSPPCWMKLSGVCSGPREAALGSGHLDNWIDPTSGYYQVLADFIADFSQAVLDSVGVAPYGISIQNEPYFHEPYNSCVYFEEGLNQMVTLARASLDAKGLSGVRLFGAEHMFHNGTNYYGLMLDNPGLDVWAVHGYSDGVDPDYGTAADWEAMYATVNGKGKKLWMTETTGPGNLLSTARYLHAALYSGKVSLWTWWAYADNLGTYGLTDGVATSFIPDGTYWASKHYFRFIRPGAVMIGCSSDDAGLYASAFKNTDNTYAIVLVNTNAAAATADINGTGLPSSWQRYASSSTLNCAHSGQVSSTGITVPASGVVTLLSGDPIPVLPADTTADVVTAPTPSNTIGELNIKGDDSIQVYVNGTLVDLGDDGKGVVHINQGENVVACRLVNHAWGGGMLASMLLPDGDTLRSGDSWSFTYEQPPTGWNAVGFDDSGWRQAYDVGPVDMWPGFERWGLSAVNLYYQGARWLYCDAKMYFRKNVAVSGNQMLRVFGNNFSYKCYVDGVLVGEGTEFECLEGGCLGETNPTNITTLSAGTHCIAWEITEARVDGNGVLFKGWSQPTQNTYGDVIVDSTWPCWPDEVAGWNTAGFDDSQWFHPGIDTTSWMGRGPNNAVVPYCYPREFWYRTTFTSSQESDVVLNIKAPVIGVSPRVERYDLLGRKARSTRKHSLSNSIILEKVAKPDGAAQVRKELLVK